MSKDWIQSVDKEMKRKGTVGAFTKQAKRAGMSVHDFAIKVKNNPKDFSERTRRRANLALTFEKLADKKKKYMHGGKTQGYNAQLDESLGNRLAPERKYKQSLKDRRDESKAGNKTLGRRAYSSVRAMDKGDRMMKHGGKVKYAHGGYHQGYDDKENESLGMRTGAESTKKQKYKARREDSYGKWGKRDEEDRGIKLAKGGKLSKKAVKEGYIRRDRYDKLKKDLKEQEADCRDDIKTMKKDIGKKVAKRIDQVERQKNKECDKKETKMSKKEEGNEMLIGGVAGFLLGMFLGNR